MSAHRQLERTSPNGQVRLRVTCNGRASATVEACTTSPEAPLAQMDVICIQKAEARARYVNQIGEPWREDARDLLDLLAKDFTDSQVAAPRETPAEKRVMFRPVEPWDTPVDGATLLEAIAAHIPQYVVLPAPAVPAIALWILHTYLLDAAAFTPYLLVTSPVRECGKTTLLELLEHLAYHAKRTGGITPGALPRFVEINTPTLILDEVDTRIKSEGGEAFRGILNTGFQRDGTIMLCMGDEHTPTELNVFCPKVLGGIAIAGAWATVTSRSIPVRLERASKGQLRGLKKLRGDRIELECAPFRSQLRRWADDNIDAVRDADPATPDTLGARQADIWRPLLAIADTVGGDWPARARTAALDLHRIADEETDRGLLLLADVRELFQATAPDGRSLYAIDTKGQGPVLPSATLVAELAKREDRPWADYRGGRPITTNGVARLLRRFGITPDTHRTNATTAKGYLLADFQPQFDRYLPPVTVATVTVTVDEPATVTAQSIIPLEDREICYGVTVEKGGGRRNEDELMEEGDL